MTVIYLHGLDSDPNATKAQITKAYAEPFGISVLSPDLNCPPEQSLIKIAKLVESHPDAVLLGSSLGGYFANVVSDLTGMPAVLLNPSIRPDLSFRRFLSDNFGLSAADLQADAPERMSADTHDFTQ